MPHRVIDTVDDLSDFTRFLSNLKLPITVEWVQGRDRTKDQNALQWLWASEVAKQLGDRDAADVQADWKLRHGVPIMREDSAEFREAYDSMIKPLPFEAKQRVMRDLDFGVTRLMKVRQMVRYMDTIQRECLQLGIHLTEPDPELSKYQNRYRQKDAA
ncbi:hypothetical protein [Ruegeria sp.]|uniref:hypothetical protein n=1 Tax=Ruegeria sp. TaxID=1879320 RepID=UPI003B5BC17A